MTLRFVALLFLLALVAPALAAPRSDEAVVAEAFDALAALRLEDAERLAASIPEARREAPNVLALRGALAFHRGDYDSAARDLERASVDLRGAPHARASELFDLARRTGDATRGFVEARSSDGRYVVRFREGRDRVLVPYALDVLRRQDERLAAIFGSRLPGPIRLEVFADASELAKVSTLSVEAIERTGTIALCKWNKLMLTSPRALARGYAWADTVAHELVHLHLAYASRDRAPVWMQEGFAKYLERAYRTDAPSLELSPPEADLFARKLHENALLPFDAFHPSIALLPSQDDAALAFAEVSTLVADFHRRAGDDGMRRVIASVASGTDARLAFSSTVGMPFARYERTVFDDARQRMPRPRNETPMLPMRFVHGGASDDVADVKTTAAARHVRLGDMLWSRGRAHAASVEYRRASDTAPDDAIVGSRLARSALEGAQHEQAASAAERVLARYPHHEPALAVLAAAREGRSDRAGAYRAAVDAIRQNPFDPVPHCVLGRVSHSEPERQRESETCRTLGGERRAPTTTETR